MLFEQVLRNYRKEIQKIYVLSPNSAEDERDENNNDSKIDI